MSRAPWGAIPGLAPPEALFPLSSGFDQMAYLQAVYLQRTLMGRIRQAALSQGAFFRWATGPPGPRGKTIRLTRIRTIGPP